jgi:hypothetical protein
MTNETKIRGAGGTQGGIGEFFVGLAMAVAGAYLITNRVVVATGFWSMWGYNMFGLSLVPLIIGIGILFFNGKSIGGWLLVGIGVVIIFTGILMNLHIYFQPTSLFKYADNDRTSGRWDWIDISLSRSPGTIGRGVKIEKAGGLRCECWVPILGFFLDQNPKPKAKNQKGGTVNSIPPSLVLASDGP